MLSLPESKTFETYLDSKLQSFSRWAWIIPPIPLVRLMLVWDSFYQLRSWEQVFPYTWGGARWLSGFSEDARAKQVQGGPRTSDLSPRHRPPKLLAAAEFFYLQDYFPYRSPSAGNTNLGISNQLCIESVKDSSSPRK